MNDRHFGGIDMMVGKGSPKVGNKMTPRKGAAKGDGIGGYNSASVIRALGSRPVYHNGSDCKKMK